MNDFNKVIQLITNSIQQNELLKLILSEPKATSDLKKVIIQPVIIKQKNHLSFVYRYTTKDITKNFLYDDALINIKQLLQTQFNAANIFTTTTHYSVNSHQNKIKIKEQKNTTITNNNLQHDRQKDQLFTQTIFLEQLGLTNSNGQILQNKGKKINQIRKFVEILGGLIEQSSLDKNKTLQIYDMGCGKAYLTFALYDYLHHTKNISTTITGVEARTDLIRHNNQLAQQIKFNHLYFEEGYISDFNFKNIDILIALHACNTATDDALYKAIKANAKIIVVAPCCHKEIRQQISSNDIAMQSILKHGILAERQAEMLTDTIRALLLEINGYKTKVFEFVSTEHTAKNVMITAQKRDQTIDVSKYQAQLQALKQQFNIKTQHLEQLLLKC
ncbi:MAG: SAM-dependent methyltransferase [Chitinophagales bacterium]|nr:SAM-dependent methyltransferase [Chitinophagales bacterium]